MDRGVAVVTGGSKGIGAATARMLGTAGWTVCVGYRSDGAGAAAVADAVVAGGGTAWAVPVDVTVDESITALFEAVDERGEPLTALVNNAGAVGRKARVDEIDGRRLRHVLALNVVGPFLCAREAVRRMSTAYGGAGGAIVNVSSAASRLGSPGEYVDYAATKGAIDTFTIGLAKEVATEGVRVNAVRPGIIDTGIHVTGGQPDRVARLGPSIPVRRAGEPDEVAKAIVWLLSDEASYCTGAILDVSGGR